MIAPDKSEFLRARVSKQNKVDFEEICQSLGKTATEQLRELIETFVHREYGRLHDRVTVHIFQPPKYETGAWRVTIKLRDPQEATWSGVSVPFALPDLPKRRLSSDPEYGSVIPSQTDLIWGGLFVQGEWRGHLYTNGCPESENPTSIDDVRDCLTKVVMQLIDRLGAPSGKT